ncbi:BON domain-containing protein [Methylocella sp.]|uniref:BON domain-containing protein n=1 Tax=Methylocella sp. TaxID=1978226 RepID=UPI0035AEEB1C
MRNSQREGFGSDRLGGDPYVNAEDIEVTVASGEIALTGAADDREQRRRAEIVAERVAGVSHVQNNLRVKDRRVGRHDQRRSKARPRSPAHPPGDRLNRIAHEKGASESAFRLSRPTTAPYSAGACSAFSFASRSSPVAWST